MSFVSVIANHWHTNKSSLQTKQKGFRLQSWQTKCRRLKFEFGSLRPPASKPWLVFTAMQLLCIEDAKAARVNGIAFDNLRRLLAGLSTRLCLLNPLLPHYQCLSSSEHNALCPDTQKQQSQGEGNGGSLRKPARIKRG
jgi:hypothetical protein